MRHHAARRIREFHQQCVGTATLPAGTLTLARAGRVFGGGDPRGAVLGGSGAYAGATGDFTEGKENDGRTPYTFHIWLPKTCPAPHNARPAAASR